MQQEVPFLNLAVNKLQEDQFSVRKQGLKTILEFYKSEQTSEIKIQFFFQNLFRNLLHTIQDSHDANREMSINIIQNFLKCVEEESKLTLERDKIIDLIKALFQRINGKPFNEKREHIRLELIKTFQEILKIIPQYFESLISDVNTAIGHLLLDEYAEVKKYSAQFVIDSIQELGKFKIGNHCKLICKSLIENIKFRQKDIRKISIKALGFILTTEGAGSQLQNSLQGFKVAINDSIKDVRKQAYESIAYLLINLSYNNLKQFESELMLFLMNSMADDLQEIQYLGQEKLEEVGRNRVQLAIQMQEEIVIQ